MKKTIPLVQKIKEIMMEEYLTSDTSIFLCGGARKDQAKLRFALGKRIEQLKSQYLYSIYYPETLFTEILLGHNQSDLLSLENFLAESVNAIVIPLQSAGTFTELGAFSNHANLRDKLIVIIDPKYKLSNSFINSGPLKLLKKETKSKVLYSTLSAENLTQLSYKIADASRKIKDQRPLLPSIENPLISRLFYLSIIYIFDPIDISLFRKIVSNLIKKDKDGAKCDTIVSSILREKNIRLLKNNFISFHEKGFDEYLKNKGFSNNDVHKLINRLSSFRIEAINLYYRNKGIVWGEEVYRP